jgi:hypothetical protein
MMKPRPIELRIDKPETDEAADSCERAQNEEAVLITLVGGRSPLNGVTHECGRDKTGGREDRGEDGDDRSAS